MGEDEPGQGAHRRDLLTPGEERGEVNERATQPSLLDPGLTPPTQPTTGEQWAGIAQVTIDSPLPHLDRLFDYGIPKRLDDDAQVGARVRVRFGGRNVDGFIVARHRSTAQPDIKPIRRVVGGLPVLTPEILELCSQIAREYAGGLADVLRLAIPPRHAGTEERVLAQEPAAPPTPEPPRGEAWEPYRAGRAFLRRLGAGESPRAVWSALPTPAGEEPQEWARAICSAAQATLSSGRGVLVLVPTAEDLTTVRSAFEAAAIDVVELTAELGPAARYENFLTCLLGRRRVVVGTRAAAYAPVEDLGLIVCWDEVHDAYSEPRAPYPHARETLVRRATLAGAGALIGGFARSPQAEHLLATGWAQPLAADRSVVRERTPRVHVADEFDREREGGVGHARIPSFAWQQIRATLEKGPVLMQVPRAGFTPALACVQCRRSARCNACYGPLAATDASRAHCTWCGARAEDWRCPHCEHGRWRARSVGAQRTAEELGRAFPGVPIRVSGKAAGRLGMVADEPGLIIATPGAEPPARSGYPLAVLLDAGILTELPFLNAPIAALHRWLRAAALTRGQMLILGEPLMATAQAALRWDPGGYARRELAEWTELGFPPAHTVVTVTGEKPDVSSFARHLPQVPTLSVLGPVAIPGEVSTPADDELGIPVRSPLVRLLMRVEAEHHLELTAAVRGAVRIKSARRDGQPVKVRVNPTEEL